MNNEAGLFTVKDIIFNGNQDPDHNAIESPGYQPLTYADLRQQILYVVKTLNAMGFHRNDRIAVISPAGPETAVILVSVMTGFTAVPLNPQNKKQEYERYFSQLKIKAIIIQEGCETTATGVAKSQNIPIIELLPVPDKAGKFKLKGTRENDLKEAEFACPSDISRILMTSGTTSRPKIVPSSQKQASLRQKKQYQALKITPTDRCLHILPYYHGMGIGMPLLSVLYAGGTVICPKEFIPSDFLYLLKTFRPTFYSAGPALHQGILREIKRIPLNELKNNSLRFIRSGSAFLPDHAINDLETLLGVPVIVAFGSSETGPISINFPQKHGSVGIPLVDYLSIMDENGNIVGSCSEGEIVVKGETVFSGYEDDPDANKAAFTDGWYKTGDMGYLDNEGYLFLTGRKKELINKGGEKISPAEIDNVLMTHPSVKDAMTFGITDPILGEDLAAMVEVENQNVTETELRKYLINRLIQFKVPKKIYFVDEIPRGTTGKLLRYVGTDRYESGDFEDILSSEPLSNAVSSESSVNQEKIMQIWKNILDIKSLEADDDFFRCGGNSLAAIELLIKIQREFHVNFPPDTIYLYPTIRQQARMIARKSDNKAYHPLIVPIREKGTLPPLFCIHPLDGWIGQYQTISPLLGQNRPLFGIRAMGLEEAEYPYPTIDEAVREYAEAIKTVQKNGPYYLIGYSAGGLLAFALSCHLQKIGEKVIYLGIIDQSGPKTPKKKLFNYIKEHGLNAPMLTIYHFLKGHLQEDTIIKSLFLKSVSAISPVYNPMPPKWVSDLPERQQLLVKHQKRAIDTYKFSKFSGNAYLFSLGPDLLGNPERGWNAFIKGKIIIFDINGEHLTIFDQPYRYLVGQKVEESLRMVD
jgi:oxalate---CoA ligase